MQEIKWKGSKGQLLLQSVSVSVIVSQCQSVSVFLQWDIGHISRFFLKKMLFSVETKMNYFKFWNFEDDTMWKSTSSAFQKFITYGSKVVLIHSYWPPKFTQFSFFFNSKMQCQKRHGHNIVHHEWDILKFEKNAFCNMRQIHFAIREKYILQFITNIFFTNPSWVIRRPAA